jgi:hypothetical protein
MSVLTRFYGISLFMLATAAQAAVPDFRLLDTQGRSHALYRTPNAKQIALIAGDPASPGWPALLQATAALSAAQPAASGVQVYLLSPVSVAPDSDGPVILLDPSQTVLTALGLTRAGEALLLEAGTWEERYRGPLGDPQPAASGLAAALAGQVLPAVAVPEASPLPISWPAAVSYDKEVAPILAAKCGSCHREGDTAPFAMSSHRKVAGWAKMIEEVLLTDRMPPGQSAPGFGPFEQERGLTPEEKRTLVAWVRAGAPAGTGEDPLPALVTPRTGAWRLGEPDLILEMPQPFDVPAEGVIEYQLFKVPTKFTEDTWIRGVEVQPGNPEVLHHSLIFIEYPEAIKHLEPRVMGGAGGFFAGFVPGATPRFFPEGTGKLIPAGATFLFQMHYVTTGKATQDQTKLGLYLSKEKPAQRLITTAAFNPGFEIPPHNADFHVTAEERVNIDANLWAMSPHMYYRGKHFRYTAHYPDGRVEPLLSVPAYNFDWQTQFRYQQPKPLPKGTRIVCEGGFDNSAANPFNPNPDATVRFGDQTYEEMFIGYLEFAVDPDKYVRMQEKRRERMQQDRQEFQSAQPVVSSDPPLTPEELLGTLWEADQFKFRFLADGVFVVNELIKGVYRIENNRVYIDVVGEHFELDIIGKGLYFNGSYAITRLE